MLKVHVSIKSVPCLFGVIPLLFNGAASCEPQNNNSYFQSPGFYFPYYFYKKVSHAPESEEFVISHIILQKMFLVVLSLKTQDSGLKTQDSGHRTSCFFIVRLFSHRTSNIVHRTSCFGCSFRISYFIFRICSVPPCLCGS